MMSRQQVWANNGRDVKISKSGCLGSWPHMGYSLTVAARAAVCQRVPLGDKCLLPDFLKHLSFRNAQNRMLCVKFTRLENLRTWGRVNSMNIQKVQDTQISFVTTIGVEKHFPENENHWLTSCLGAREIFTAHVGCPSWGVRSMTREILRLPFHG